MKLNAYDDFWINMCTFSKMENEYFTNDMVIYIEKKSWKI